MKYLNVKIMKHLISPFDANAQNNDSSKEAFTDSV